MTNGQVGGASFRTESFKADEHKFNVGAGLTYNAGDQWAFKGEYDFETRDDYQAHSRFMRVNYSF